LNSPNKRRARPWRPQLAKNMCSSISVLFFLLATRWANQKLSLARANFLLAHHECAREKPKPAMLLHMFLVFHKIFVCSHVVQLFVLS
jgi:hypothetical protein